MMQHGYNRYTHGCRCLLCTTAKADYIRKRRAEAKRQRAEKFTTGRYVVEGITHGYSGYQNYGCRCWTCTEAKAQRSKEEYARKKVSS